MPNAVTLWRYSMMMSSGKVGKLLRMRRSEWAIGLPVLQKRLEQIDFREWLTIEGPKDRAKDARFSLSVKIHFSV